MSVGMVGALVFLLLARWLLLKTGWFGLCRSAPPPPTHTHLRHLRHLGHTRTQLRLPTALLCRCKLCPQLTGQKVPLLCLCEHACCSIPAPNAGCFVAWPDGLSAPGGGTRGDVGLCGAAAAAGVRRMKASGTVTTDRTGTWRRARPSRQGDKKRPAQISARRHFCWVLLNSTTVLRFVGLFSYGAGEEYSRAGRDLAEREIAKLVQVRVPNRSTDLSEATFANGAMLGRGKQR